MNSVIVRTSEVDMMITPPNIQLWNWRALFLIESNFVKVVLLRNKNTHSDLRLMAVIDEALDLGNWNRGHGYEIRMCSKLYVCVLHNVSNFKLYDGGNFWHFVGEILRSLDLYGLLAKCYGQKWIRVQCNLIRIVAICTDPFYWAIGDINSSKC